MLKTEDNKAKFYDKTDVDMFAKALGKAIESVGCDPRCFDWLSYNPDFHIAQGAAKKAA